MKEEHMTTLAAHNRRQQALVLYEAGWLYRHIAVALKISANRARQLVIRARWYEFNPPQMK